MKVAILFAAILVFFVVENVSGKIFINQHAPPPIVTRNPRARAPILHEIEMPVDHFNANDNRTYTMRYYANNQHWKGVGSPIIIYLGGEWSINPNSLMGGQVFDIAEESGGYMFYTEHRYYGYSYPTSDFTTENLKYLAVEQALADVVEFVKRLKENDDYASSKVAVIGGSYSATMATWLRVRYPEYIDAAYASSAPLLALDDYKQYYEVVGANIKLESPECYEVIREATQKMEELFETESGLNELSTLFKTCTPLERGFPHQDHLFTSVANAFAGTVQYAYPGQIKAECQSLLSYQGDALDKLASYVRQYNGNVCIGGYNEELEIYQDTEANANVYRAWFYQTCTEFGFFQTGNSTEQPFGVNWFSNLSHAFCKDAYGIEPKEILGNIDITNWIWGALTPDVTKVISVHGTVDPWHAIGLLENLNEDAPAILVPGTSHCADLKSISADDSEEMRRAKQTAKELIIKWTS